MTYEEYLQSEHWQNLKREFWSSKIPKLCKLCGVGGKLELHHKNGYDNKGQERLPELAPLCRNCHEKAHRSGAGRRLPLTRKVLSDRYNKLLSQYERKQGKRPKRHHRKKVKNNWAEAEYRAIRALDRSSKMLS